MVARRDAQHDRGDDDRDQRGILEVDPEPQRVQRGVIADAEGAN
jgi:hypothetical protein